MRKQYNQSISELKAGLLEDLAAIDGGSDPVELAMKKFDDSEDQKRRKRIALHLCKEAGASKDTYGEEADSDHAYQYQLQRTAQDVWEDALLYGYQEHLRDEGKEEEKKTLSKERQKVHYPGGANDSLFKLRGSASDSVIMNRIRSERKKLLEKYGLDKKMPAEDHAE